MKNKKIISLISALAMLFTMFSAFTVVNADNKGMALTGDLSKDGKTITLNLAAVGITDKIDNFTFAVNVPDGVTKADIATTVMQGMSATVNVADGVLYMICTDPSAEGVALPADNKIATAVITLKAPLAANYVAKLQNDASIKENSADAGLNVEEGTMDAAEATVQKWQDPNKKPDTIERPAPVATEDPGTVKPVPTDVPAGTKGIALSSSTKDNVITVEAKAVGITDKIDNFTLAVNVPDGVTKADIATTVMQGMSATVNVADGVLYMICTDPSAEGIALPADNKIATAVITLKSALAEPFAFTLQNDASIKENSADAGLNVEEGTMTAASTVVKPSEEEKKTEKPDQALKNYVGKGYEDAIAAAKTAGNDVYLTVDVKKGDDKAVYGADYAFEYPAGNVIKTEAEFLNLVHGYTDADMADVINNGTFKIYNKAVNKIATTLNATNTESQLVDPVDKTIGGKTPSTPKPSELSLKAAVSPTTINPNTSAKITATVTSGDDVKVEEGDIVQFLINKDDKYVEFTDDDLPTVKVDNKEYVSLEKDVKTVDEKGVAEVTARVAALEKTGSTTVLVRYFKNGANTAEDKPVKSQNVNFKVTAVKGGNGGSGSSSDDKSNSKNIAGTGSNSYAGNNTGKVAFTDINTVVWAQDAINSLVARGVLNGRNNLEFDPNGTVTRAEFAKMVVLAFGLTGGKDNEFTDVDTSAWYAPYVARGVANSVITGYDDGTFRPNGLISRQEMSAMVMRAVNAASKSVPATVAAASFSDNYQIGDWAKEAVSTLQQGGVINGYEDGTFKPYGNATRAEAAVVIYRAFTNAK